MKPKQRYSQQSITQARVQVNNKRLVVKQVYLLNFTLWLLVAWFGVITPLQAQSNTYFRTEAGIPYIPVLSSAPASPAEGLMYINSANKVIYKYEGSQWVTVGAGIAAKITLTPASILYKGQSVTPDIQYIYSGGINSTICAVTGCIYKWYRANDAVGTGKTEISSGTGVPTPYTVTDSDVGKYIGLGITPVTACNASAFESISWKRVIPLTPSVASVDVSGISNGYAIKGTVLTASFSGYTCSPVQIPTDVGTACTYQWYYANDAAGKNKTLIYGRKLATYNVNFSDGYTTGKYIAVGVTPVAKNGNAGTEKMSTWYLTSAVVPVYDVVNIAGLTEGKAQNNTTLAAVTGIYSVTPSVTGTEGSPAYQWYYTSDATGTGKTAIAGQTERTHTVNIGLGYGYRGDEFYLAVGVTPFTTTGETGTEVLSNWVKIQVIRAADGTLVNELKSPSGRVWMDRNLGAMQVANNSTDFIAYGSLFQWCRAADGHEKMNWLSIGPDNATGTPVNGTTSTASNSPTPGHSLFIANSGSYYWLNPHQTDGSLWWNGAVAGANNPCPVGYHVPTLAEWNTELALFSSNGGNSATGAYNTLRLTMPNYFRLWSDGSLANYGVPAGLYWSSSLSTYPYRLQIENGTAIMYNNFVEANGMMVRCIKN